MSQVAVILPTYHRMVSLKYAICSVIQQTYKDWTLYIIGDGCIDDTEDIVKKVSKKYPGKIKWYNLPQNHGGVHTNEKVKREDTGACARNTGFFMGKEPYIAYVDDDDAWRPYHLSILMNSIRKNDFAYSRGAIWRPPHIRRGRYKSPVGMAPPGLGRIGTNGLLHTRQIAMRSLHGKACKFRIPFTQAIPRPGVNILKYNCCREKPGILWLPANLCRGCHDWELVRRFLDRKARYTYVPTITYDIYWDMSQNQFKKLVINNEEHQAQTGMQYIL